MKVVLLKTVRGLGSAGAIVTVTDAYARNFLLPNKLVTPATPEAVATAKAQAAQRQAAAEHDQVAAEHARQRLANINLALTGLGQPNGRLYQAYHSDQIIRALEQAYHLTLPGVRLDPPSLKQSGQHAIKLEWPDHKAVTITVTIASQAN